MFWGNLKLINGFRYPLAFFPTFLDEFCTAYMNIFPFDCIQTCLTKVCLKSKPIMFIFYVIFLKSFLSLGISERFFFNWSSEETILFQLRSEKSDENLNRILRILSMKFKDCVPIYLRNSIKHPTEEYSISFIWSDICITCLINWTWNDICTSCLLKCSQIMFAQVLSLFV